MDLLEEYRNQQTWRNWESYLEHIPLNGSESVLDLGCSIGGFSDVVSSVCRKVVGVDIDAKFIECCRDKAANNQEFILSDFNTLDFRRLPQFQGVWSSFSISYLRDPMAFLHKIHSHLPNQGWVALVDISCFISGNLSRDSEFFELVRSFEKDSATSGLYDFDFGSKMESMLKTVGFGIYFHDDNVTDLELNFDGAASVAVLNNWKARLKRMNGLKASFPNCHEKIEAEMIENLSSESHTRNKNVRYVVGMKI